MSVPLFVSERSKPKITTQPLSVGCLIFERMDQIDFTGPFEVLSRMPDTSVQIIGKEVAPVRDVQGLRLSPDVSIAEPGFFDVLVVPGGYGQQALMHDEEVLGLIRRDVQNEKAHVFGLYRSSAVLCRWRAGGKTGDGRRQHHQRRRRDSRAGCGSGGGLSLARRSGCSGDPASH